MIPRLPTPAPYRPRPHASLNAARVPGLRCMCALVDGVHAESCQARYVAPDGRAS